MLDEEAIGFVARGDRIIASQPTEKPRWDARGFCWNMQLSVYSNVLLKNASEFAIDS